jgi:hypothetical protein
MWEVDTGQASTDKQQPMNLPPPTSNSDSRKAEEPDSAQSHKAEDPDSAQSHKAEDSDSAQSHKAEDPAM